MSVWEGSGNVQALDVLRALARDPEALDALLVELAWRGRRRAPGRRARALAPRRAVAPADEARRPAARRAAGTRAAGLAAGRHAPAAVADAFCATRLGAGGRTFGELPPGIDVAAIVDARAGRTARMKVVAIQPDVAIGEVERNLVHLEDLIGQAAREHAPEAIFLPESMTTTNVYDRRMRHVARPSTAPRCRCSTAPRAITTASSAAASSRSAAPTRAAPTRVVEPDGRRSSTTRTSPRSGRTTTTRRARTTGSWRRRSARSASPTASSGAARARRRGCSAACSCWRAGCTSRRSRPGGDEAVVLGPRPLGAACSTRARRRRGWRGCSASLPSIPPTSATS